MKTCVARIAAAAAMGVGLVMLGGSARAQDSALPPVDTDYGLSQQVTGDLDAMVIDA